MFLPLNTDFEKRYDIEYGDILFNEKLQHRLYCPEYDITEYLKEGKNTISFMLAPGFYEEYDYGCAKMCWKIEVTGKDNTTEYVSDGTEKYKTIFVKEADVIRGETHAHGNERGATYALLIGFCVMLVSDVLLG